MQSFNESRILRRRFAGGKRSDIDSWEPTQRGRKFSFFKSAPWFRALIRFVSALSSSFCTQFAHSARLTHNHVQRIDCMPAPESGSYFSRFFLKFVEIIAAGLATAVSAYLIAHLIGALSSPGPAAGAAIIQVAPSATSSPPAQATAPNAASSTPIPLNANDQRASPRSGSSVVLPSRNRRAEP